MVDDRQASLNVAHSWRGLVLLAFGAAAGVGLAAAGLVDPGRTAGLALPPDAAARVNGAIIRKEEYERVTAALAVDRRDGLAGADRRHVIDRLIDEELLVQRGLELGLARHDRQIRSDLTAAVIGSIVAPPEDLQPTEADLRTFYDTHRDFFAQPGRLRIREIFCRVATATDDAAALARAQEAGRRLRSGEDFAVVQMALGDREVSTLPDALLPPAKLLDYLGPTALRAALALRDGEVSEPLRASGGYRVLRILERQADADRSFADMRAEVLTEFRRENGERALRAYLDDLRARADVVIAPALR